MADTPEEGLNLGRRVRHYVKEQYDKGIPIVPSVAAQEFYNNTPEEQRPADHVTLLEDLINNVRVQLTNSALNAPVKATSTASIGGGTATATLPATEIDVDLVAQDAAEADEKADEVSAANDRGLARQHAYVQRLLNRDLKIGPGRDDWKKIGKCGADDLNYVILVRTQLIDRVTAKRDMWRDMQAVLRAENVLIEDLAEDRIVRLTKGVQEDPTAEAEAEAILSEDKLA